MRSAVVKWVSGTYRLFTQLNLEVYKPVLTERRHQEEIIARSAKLRPQQHNLQADVGHYRSISPNMVSREPMIS
jgi:hypothetical protein